MLIYCFTNIYLEKTMTLSTTQPLETLKQTSKKSPKTTQKPQMISSSNTQTNQTTKKTRKTKRTTKTNEKQPDFRQVHKQMVETYSMEDFFHWLQTEQQLLINTRFSRPGSAGDAELAAINRVIAKMEQFLEQRNEYYRKFLL